MGNVTESLRVVDWNKGVREREFFRGRITFDRVMATEPVDSLRTRPLHHLVFVKDHPWGSEAVFFYWDDYFDDDNPDPNKLKIERDYDFRTDDPKYRYRALSDDLIKDRFPADQDGYYIDEMMIRENGDRIPSVWLFDEWDKAILMGVGQIRNEDLSWLLEHLEQFDLPTIMEVEGMLRDLDDERYELLGPFWLETQLEAATRLTTYLELDGKPIKMKVYPSNGDVELVELLIGRPASRCFVKRAFAGYDGYGHKRYIVSSLSGAIIKD